MSDVFDYNTEYGIKHGLCLMITELTIMETVLEKSLICQFDKSISNIQV